MVLLVEAHVHLLLGIQTQDYSNDDWAAITEGSIGLYVQEDSLYSRQLTLVASWELSRGCQSDHNMWLLHAVCACIAWISERGCPKDGIFWETGGWLVYGLPGLLRAMCRNGTVSLPQDSIVKAVAFAKQHGTCVHLQKIVLFCSFKWC